MKQTLKIEEIEKGIAHPLEKSSCNQQEYKEYGGITYPDLIFAELSLQKRPNSTWYTGANPSTNPKDIKYIDEEVVFLGPFSAHYGHFLLESISRLWFFLNPQNKKYKAIYLTETSHFNKNLLELLYLFGIDDSQLIEIKAPTQFKKIIIPEQSFYLNQYCTEEYINTIDQIKSSIQPSHYKKLYFSKKLTNKFNHRGIGENIIEKIFKQNGYKIIYPEKISIKEQISLLKGCKDFVTTSGTLAHQSLFVENSPSCNITILNRSNEENPSQNAINKHKKYNYKEINANFNFFVRDYTAPCLLGITDELEDFFKEKNFQYNKRYFCKKFKNNIYNYLIEYGKYHQEIRKIISKTNYNEFDKYIILENLLKLQKISFKHPIKTFFKKIKAKFKTQT